MQKLKILLIEAIDHSKAIYKEKGIGLAYIASYLMHCLPEIEIKIINNNVDFYLHKFAPDLVGISSVTMNYLSACKIAKQCKKYGIPVIIGGYHISFLPSSLTKDMDIGVIGEGEETMLAICKLFLKRSHLDKNLLKNIRGIVYYNEKNKLIKTESTIAINPLDQLPFPNRDLLTKSEQKNPIVYSSRGCFYNCIFCSPTRFWNGVRFFSAEYVINEISYLYEKYGAKHIYLADDLFISNRNRLKEMEELFKSFKYRKKITLNVSCRANLVDEEVIGYLKSLNVTHVTIGLESGNDVILSFLKRDNICVEDNKRAISLLKSAGIYVKANFIIGSPQETREQIMDSINFAKRYEIDDIACYLLYPLPGTPIWDYAYKRGLVSEDMDWRKCNSRDISEHSIILSEKLSWKELSMYKDIFLKNINNRDKSI